MRQQSAINDRNAQALSYRWISLLNNERFAASSVLLAHVVDQVRIHSEGSITVSVKKVHKLVAYIHINKVTERARNANCKSRTGDARKTTRW